MDDVGQDCLDSRGRSKQANNGCRYRQRVHEFRVCSDVFSCFLAGDPISLSAWVADDSRESSSCPKLFLVNDTKGR